MENMENQTWGQHHSSRLAGTLMRWGKKVFFVFFFLFVIFLFAENEGESKTDIPDESGIILDAKADPH